MKTKDWIHAEIRNAIHPDDPVPPMPAIILLLCEAIDRLEKRLNDVHSKINILNIQGAVK